MAAVITRRWREAACVGVVACFAFAVLLTSAGAVLAQVDPGTGAAPTDEASPADEAAPGPTNVESVTTTETKLRRVVVGLVAIAAVTGVLTLAYARHTSPRRRAHEAAARDDARARRMAAAAALGGLDSPPSEHRTAPQAPQRTAAPQATQRTAAPVQPGGNGGSGNGTARARRDPRPQPRPDPRPQPRRRG